MRSEAIHLFRRAGDDLQIAELLLERLAAGATAMRSAGDELDEALARWTGEK